MGVYVGKLYVDTCSKATSILNKSNLKGDKMSSDPAFNMAAQLLGAMLNVQVGAGICPNYLTAIQEGQTLLFNHSFNGTTYSTFSAAEATVANTLAT